MVLGCGRGLGVAMMGVAVLAVGMMGRPVVRQDPLRFVRWQRVRVTSQAAAVAFLTLPLPVLMLRDGRDSLFWRSTRTVN